MPQREPVRRRIQALDGTSFRFERKAQTLLVNDMPAQIHTREQGTVELVTEYKTVQVSGATYWTMIYDDLVPTPMSAGMILAKYDELVGQLWQIALERSQEE